MVGWVGKPAEFFIVRDLCKIPIFGTFLRNALLERLKIFQYSLRVLRCCCFELRSNLRFCKGLSMVRIGFTV